MMEEDEGVPLEWRDSITLQTGLPKQQTTEKNSFRSDDDDEDEEDDDIDDKKKSSTLRSGKTSQWTSSTRERPKTNAILSTSFRTKNNTSGNQPSRKAPQPQLGEGGVPICRLATQISTHPILPPRQHGQRASVMKRVITEEVAFGMLENETEGKKNLIVNKINKRKSKRMGNGVGGTLQHDGEQNNAVLINKNNNNHSNNNNNEKKWWNRKEKYYEYYLENENKNVEVIVPDGAKARAIWDFKGEKQNDLTFQRGDIITILRRFSNGWWEGELDGKIGDFPSSYIEEDDDEFLEMTEEHLSTINTENNSSPIGYNDSSSMLGGKNGVEAKKNATENNVNIINGDKRGVYDNKENRNESDDDDQKPRKKLSPNSRRKQTIHFVKSEQNTTIVLTGGSSNYSPRENGDRSNDHPPPDLYHLSQIIPTVSLGENGADQQNITTNEEKKRTINLSYVPQNNSQSVYKNNNNSSSFQSDSINLSDNDRRSGETSWSEITQEVKVQGFLSKKGHNRRNWKIRYFTLQSNRLTYYSNPPEVGNSKLLGMILIDSSSVVRLAPEMKRSNCFAVQTNRKPFVLYLTAPSGHEMIRWMDALCECLE